MCIIQSKLFGHFVWAQAEHYTRLGSLYVLNVIMLYHNMYADDTAICVSARNKAEVSRLLQEELSRLNEWLCANRLSLHVGKTSCMLVTTAQRIRLLPQTYHNP